MTKETYDRIAAGLEDAIAYAKGDNATLGKHLQDMREEAGLTIMQASLDTDVFHQSIRAFECDEKKPNWYTLERLLAVYGYEIEFMKLHTE